MTDSEKQIYNIEAQISSYQTQYNSLSIECDELYTAYTSMYSLYWDVEDIEVDIYVSDLLWSGNKERWWNFHADIIANSDKSLFAEGVYNEYEKLYDLYMDKIAERGIISNKVKELKKKLKELTK